jgi:hypothetical protein
MRRIADLYPGNAKTDARDAFIIADATRTLPHALRRLDVGDDALAELDVLVGYDDDLASEATRISNRIRGLLTGIHPALERVLGPKAAHPAVLEILSRCGGPVGIRAAGRRRLTTIATKHAPRMGTKLVDNILTALDEQTVVVPGTTAADTVLPRLAESLKTVLQQRKTVAAEVEEILDAHPLAQVLTSMPGIGVGPQPASSSRSVTPPRSSPQAISPPTPASRRSPTTPAAASAANTQPAAATANSNGPSSSPPSQPCPTPPAGPTTTGNEPRQETQRRPHLPRTTPLRRPVRHAPHHDPLPATRAPGRLTTT